MQASSLKGAERRKSSMYAISLTPSCLSHAIIEYVILLNTQGAEDRPKGRQ